jgi:ABC-type amino acid transport substrate-binding protein
MSRAKRTATCAAAIFAVLAGCALARPLGDVQNSGVLRVAVYQDYKPYSWREGGRVVGIDVEIAEALAKSMNVRLDLFEVRADDNINDDLRNGVWKGSVVGAAPGDVMLHVPFDKAVERENDRVALLGPYHVDGLAMAVDPAKASEALDLSLLTHDKAAVAVGTIGDMILISARDHALLPNVVHERDLEHASQDFEDGRVAAFYGEASATEAFARKGKRPFAIVYPKTGLGGDWTIGMAVRKDSRDLGLQLTKTLDGLQSSGALARIFSKYGVDWRKPAAVE